MKPADYKCRNCSFQFEYIAGYGEDFPEKSICPECGHNSNRVYVPIHGIIHQGKVGNYKNGYTSSERSIKKT